MELASYEERPRPQWPAWLAALVERRSIVKGKGAGKFLFPIESGTTTMIAGSREPGIFEVGALWDGVIRKTSGEQTSGCIRGG